MMIDSFWLILTLLDSTNGSPYYYRENKHHSEHHKEYSYGNGQPSYESSPQKYYESSHFSSQVTPERYYKLESNPSFSNGFSQFSGSQSSFHQGGYQSSHTIPLSTGQSQNVGGIPGSYVIKQVKVYRQPSLYSSQTGYFGSSSHNSHIEGRELETGQREESLYAGQHENFGQKEESLYTGQHEENFGQREESLYQEHHKDNVGQKEESVDEGQHEERLDERTGEFMRQNVQSRSLYHQAPSAVQTSSLYGQKLINVDFQAGSNIGQQTEELKRPKEENLYNQHMEHFDEQETKGDLEIGRIQENLNTQNSQHVVKTIQSSPTNDGQGAYKYYEKRIITYGNPAQDSNIYKQTYIRHNGENLYSPTTSKPFKSFDNTHSELYHQTKHVSYSQETPRIPPKIETFRSNSEKPTFILPVKNQSYREQQESKSILGQQIEPQSFTSTLEVGQEEESLDGQHSQDLGQQLVHDNLEIGQQPDCDGQLMELGAFKVGQTEEGSNEQQIHFWQRQDNSSKFETHGQQAEPIYKNAFEQPRNVGRLETGNLEIGHQNLPTKPYTIVKQNITRTLMFGHNLQSKPSSSKPINQDEVEDQRGDEQNPQTGFLDLGQREENVGQLETSDLGIGQREDTLEIGQQSQNFGQYPEKGELLIGQKEVNLDSKIPESYNLEIGQKEESEHTKLTDQTTKQPNQKDITSYGKTYSQHESYYMEQKQTKDKEQKVDPNYKPIYITSRPKNINQENMKTNQRTNYFELQQKAEALALQLGLEDNTKERSSQQEIDLYENKEQETTPSTTEVYAAEIEELGLENQHNFEEASIIPHKKVTTWEAHREEYGLQYPQPSQTAYTSKKHSKYSYVKHGYNPQPQSQNHGYDGESKHSSQSGSYQHYGSYKQGYSMNGGNYFNDQPVQRTHTSGSQFSFSSSSSGSSQDKHKVIDDFLKELDGDIARTSHQQRQQQGSYAEVTPNQTGRSGVNYYSQTVTSHSSSSSGGTSSGGDTGRTWFQRVGDKLGATYNQAKDKAKEVAKTVKESVGY